MLETGLSSIDFLTDGYFGWKFSIIDTELRHSLHFIVEIGTVSFPASRNEEQCFPARRWFLGVFFRGK